MEKSELQGLSRKKESIRALTPPTESDEMKPKYTCWIDQWGWVIYSPDSNHLTFTYDSESASEASIDDWVVLMSERGYQGKCRLYPLLGVFGC